jgi:hypothetical protein
MQQWVSVWMGVTPRETVGLQHPALVVVLMRHTITERCQVVHFRLQHSCIRKFSPILGLHAAGPEDTTTAETCCSQSGTTAAWVISVRDSVSPSRLC